jgi:flagellar biosynthesis protein FlhF
MKIKRFFAEDMKQAMILIRESLGTDAIILQSSPAPNGLEVVAAVDPDALPERRVKRKSTPIDMSDAPAPKEPPRPASLQEAPVAPARQKTASESYASNMPEDVVQLSTAKRQVTQAPSAQMQMNMEANKAQFKSLIESARQVMNDAPEMAEPEQAPEAVEAIAPKAEVTAAPAVNDEAISAMKEEISLLKTMLEEQFKQKPQETIRTALTPIQGLMRDKLLALDIDEDLANSYAKAIEGLNDVELAWQYCQSKLAQQIPANKDDIVAKGGVVALIGPTGVGKTTTIAKLAARCALRHGVGSVGLITTDSYRIGAHEQLKTFGRILGVNVKAVDGSKALRDAIEEMKDKKLVLIDTAGMGQRDVRIPKELARLGLSHVKNYLVMSCTAQRRVLENTIKAFKGVPLEGTILTKLDESYSLGGAISVVLKSQLPVCYFTKGQRVPEDLTLANGMALVQEAIEIGGEVVENEPLKTAI